jgi:tetratricopeptide (TPR) repeat protein
MTGARAVALALVCAAAASEAFAQAAPRAAAAASPAPEAVFSTPPLKVRIWRDKENLEVTLVGRTEDDIVVAGGVPNAPGGRIACAAILRAQFELEYDRYEVAKAVRLNDWPAAVRLLLPVVKPVLPYLAMPENNAAELALELGTYMMRAAARTARTAGEDATRRDLAQKQYEAAYEILKDCARAQWSSVGQVGVLKGCRCLLAMNKVKTAQFHVNQMTEPMPGDAAFGHYWLIRGELEFRAGRHREAMDAVLKSVCFENKDVETFPDALLLSARCYEELLDPYRARDVYYEVARLFPRTDWSAAALERLKLIMANGLTREKEKSAIENVFFKTSDDMNKLVEQLLKDAEKPPVAAEEEEPDVTPSAVTDKPGARKAAAAEGPDDPPAAEPPPAAPPAQPAPAVAPAQAKTPPATRPPAKPKTGAGPAAK